MYFFHIFYIVSRICLYAAIFVLIGPLQQIKSLNIEWISSLLQTSFCPKMLNKVEVI